MTDTMPRGTSAGSTGLMRQLAAWAAAPAARRAAEAACICQTRSRRPATKAAAHQCHEQQARLGQQAVRRHRGAMHRRQANEAAGSAPSAADREEAAAVKAAMLCLQLVFPTTQGPECNLDE